MAVTVKQMDVAILPSNQHQNVAGADVDPAPGPTTEEIIQVISATEAVAEFTRQGQNAKLFWVAGAGSKSTDELGQMDAQGKAWLQSQPGYSFSLSLHSNTGVSQSVPTDLRMYPLIRRSADAAWAEAIAKDAAARTGFTPRTATVRLADLMYMQAFNYLPDKRVVLMETGEHQSALGATYIYRYARYDGIMVARAFIKGCGFALKEDGPVPGDVDVPPGAQFDKYRPLPPAPPVVEFTRVLKLTDPYMQGEDVRLMQTQLIKAGCNVGKAGADGILGKDTYAAVICFKTQRLTGDIDESTWDALMGVA